MNIVYLVHDLTDAAVKRRYHMLSEEGCKVSRVGFLRVGKNQDHEHQYNGTVITRTENSKFFKRVISIIYGCFFLYRNPKIFLGAQLIIARNLEMLALAVFVRWRHRLELPIVYECLDIHRFLSSMTLYSKILRAIEKKLMKQSKFIITSSPTFISNYFEARQGVQISDILLIENKLTHTEASRFEKGAADREASLTSSDRFTTWKIGWFGILRCKKSLLILIELAEAYPEMIEVHLRGKPAFDVIPDFLQLIEGKANIFFHGKYERDIDLDRIYADIHFCWAIDYYEEGHNSSWLLPNRLYESIFFGVVPIALGDVATGAWLTKRHMPIVLDDASASAMIVFIRNLTIQKYCHWAKLICTLPRSATVLENAEASKIVSTLCGQAAPYSVKL